MDTIPKHLSSLILSIYQGIDDINPWSDFCERFSQLSGYQVFSLIIRRPDDKDHGFMVHRGGSMDWINRYEEYFYKVDPFNEIPAGKALSLSNYLSPAELAVNEFYQDFLTPLDIIDVLGIDGDDSNSSTLRVQLRVCRQINEPEFDPSFKRFVETILPHIVMASRLHKGKMIAVTAGHLIDQFLNNLNIAMLVIFSSLKILSINPQGRRLFTESELFFNNKGSLQLRGRANQLRLESATEKLMTAHNNGNKEAVEGFNVTDSNGIHYSIVLRPAPHPRSTSHSPAAMTIMISSPENRSKINDLVLKGVYGFTDAETRLALLLAKGLNASEAAQVLSVSVNTVRSQLRALLNKTGTTRQADLLWMFWLTSL